MNDKAVLVEFPNGTLAVHALSADGQFLSAFAMPVAGDSIEALQGRVAAILKALEEPTVKSEAFQGTGSYWRKRTA